jgi:hypothetical protein
MLKEIPGDDKAKDAMAYATKGLAPHQMGCNPIGRPSDDAQTVRVL